MGKNAKRMVYATAAVLAVAAACFLVQDLQGHRAKDALAGTGPLCRSAAPGEQALTGWDVSVSGVSLDGSLLTCNGGNDVYLVLDGAEVYLQQEDEEGAPLKSSGTVLRQILSEQGEQALHLWLTNSGKVEQIAVCGKGV